MLTYEFRNSANVDFTFGVNGEDFRWEHDSQLKLEVADSTSVNFRYAMQGVVKDAESIPMLIQTTRQLSNFIEKEFPEQGVGYAIKFQLPKKLPVVDVHFPAGNYMYVGDEIAFESKIDNLEGVIKAEILEKGVAKVVGSRIKAVGPGKCWLKVGTDAYSRSFEVVVESRIVEEKPVEEINSAFQESFNSCPAIDFADIATDKEPVQEVKKTVEKVVEKPAEKVVETEAPKKRGRKPKAEEVNKAEEKELLKEALGK